MSTIWKKMVSAAVVCVIMTSLTAASEMYDDLPPGDMPLMIQEHNYLEPVPDSALEEAGEEDAIKSLLLYKMLTSLRNQAVAPSVLAGPKWLTSGSDLVDPETFDLSVLKGPIVKRNTKGGSNGLKVKSTAKPQTRKWKNKKGKGASMICYFKLCAFRPSYL